MSIIIIAILIAWAVATISATAFLLFARPAVWMRP